jgi:hypothetical protein
LRTLPSGKSAGGFHTTSGCVVCNEAPEQDTGEYCSAHDRALANIHDAYATWLEAYGKLAFKEYLERVLRLSETGERVMELAKFLVQHPERWDRSGP